MATWYLAKISFLQQDEKGNNKTIKSSYLFDAVSYTDAEARVTDYVAPENPMFTLEGLTKMKLNEVFFIENGAEVWFKCKVQYIVYDEKSQKEKQVPFLFLINSHDIKECYGNLIEKLGTVQDYIVSDINVTKILDVIPYEENAEKSLEIKPNMKPLSQVIQEQEAIVSPPLSYYSSEEIDEEEVDEETTEEPIAFQENEDESKEDEL
ncbi:MAG: DUF4494 domain-containing protein [Leadbetterella sp.]